MIIPGTIQCPFEIEDISRLSKSQRFWISLFGRKRMRESLSTIDYGIYYDGVFYVTGTAFKPNPTEMGGLIRLGNEEIVKQAD